MALEGLVVLGHVVLEGLGDDGTVDDGQLLELGVAGPGEISVHRARRASSPAGCLDDRGRTGHEVATREDAVHVGREGVRVGAHVASAEVELERVVGRAVFAMRGGPIERIGAPRGDRTTLENRARVGHAQVAVELRPERTQDVVIGCLTGAGDDHVARHRELAAGNRLRGAAAAGVGWTELGALKGHALDLAAPVGDDLDRRGEELELDALEARLVLLLLVDDHLLRATPVQDGARLGAEPQGGAR